MFKKILIATDLSPVADCHADWQSRHSDKPYINNANISSSDCIGCHGGRASLNQIGGPGRQLITDRCAAAFASPYSCKIQPRHQPLDGAAATGIFSRFSWRQTLRAP